MGCPPSSDGARVGDETLAVNAAGAIKVEVMGDAVASTNIRSDFSRSGGSNSSANPARPGRTMDSFSRIRSSPLRGGGEGLAVHGAASVAEDASLDDDQQVRDGSHEETVWVDVGGSLGRQ